MNLKLSAMMLATGLFLVGCDGKDDSASAGKQANDSRSPNTLMSSPKVSGPATPEAVTKLSFPKPDLYVPITNYADLNSEPAGMSLTYVVSAKSKDVLSDDEKLNRLSPDFYNETDSFKKKDIAKVELPQVNDELQKYLKNDYYSLPIAAYSQKPIAFTNLTVGAYDINQKIFPLVRYGQYCWGATIRNQQGATLEIQPSDFTCALKVTDEALAREIEGARSQGVLTAKGVLYLFIPTSKDGAANAVVSHARIELINTQNNAQLASFDL